MLTSNSSTWTLTGANKVPDSYRSLAPPHLQYILSAAAAKCSLSMPNVTSIAVFTNCSNIANKKKDTMRNSWTFAQELAHIQVWYATIIPLLLPSDLSAGSLAILFHAPAAVCQACFWIITHLIMTTHTCTHTAMSSQLSFCSPTMVGLCWHRLHVWGGAMHQVIDPRTATIQQ